MALEGEEKVDLRELLELARRLTGAVERLNGVGYSEAPYSLGQLLEVLATHQGTFLHLNAGSPPMLRTGEELVPIGEHVLTPQDCRALINGTLSPDQIRLQGQGQELDFNYMEPDQGFRFHVYLERGTPAASIRRLRTDIPKLVELGLSGGAVEKFLDAEQGGLMLLAGKPRSGKINTFAALISYINHARRTRIVTVEPLIQFWHKNELSTVIQRELGSDTRSFSQAVRQAVQQDPDILAVGGIPDRDTAEVIIQAAAGGHLVLALLDGTSCVRALDDLLSAFSNSDGRMQQLLARVMKLVVCQHLVGRADGRGLLPALEILECDDAVTSMIAHSDLRELHRHMVTQNMQTLARHLSRMIEVDSVKVDEALKFVEESELEIGSPSQLELPASEPQPTSVDDETPLMSWL